MSGNVRFNIEDTVKKNLSGDRLKNALNIFDFLKANGVYPPTVESDCWNYQGKDLFVIHAYENDDNNWFIYGNVENIDGFPICDEMREFVWANVRICNKICGCIEAPRGGGKTILGKKFENTCSCDIWFVNPDAEILELFMKFVALTKQNIDSMETKNA